ncbi:Rap/ran-GAP family protein [Histomonas meleagridis]|uniref:Rap/ran-GAP family protein n=1 Tax=Histomonas meleagridis TaxID=135588 RepID=UPI00355ABD72|nr:Rap/ran-GAP family protein [Histomonas meleagridis]KAH0800638.1 Rap/ran-GAP family protein [Histomonas meleagridis]
MIPFTVFARDDLEKHDLEMSIFGGSNPIYGEGPKTKKKEALNQLKIFYDFVCDNWATRQTFCTKILFEYIFSIVYKPWATEAGYLCKPYGFRPSSPLEIHEETIEFLKTFIGKGNDPKPLLSTIEQTKLLFGIFRDSITHSDVHILLQTLEIMSVLAKSPISTQIISFSLDTFYELQNIDLEIIKTLPENKIVQLIPQIEQFLINVLSSLKELPEKKVYLSTLTLLFGKARSIPILTVPVIQAIMRKMLSDREKSDEIWDNICDEVRNSPFAAATLCRFSQYLATIASLILFDVQKDETVKVCQSRLDRAKRVKLANKYDFICQNIEMIFNSPQEFVQTQLKQSCDFLSQYDDKLRKYPFSPLESPPHDDQSLLDLIMLYLVSFDRYPDYQEEDQQLNLFSVIYSFYHTLILLQNFPPGVIFDRRALFFNSAAHLFTASFSCAYFSLRYKAFTLLSETINSLAMRDYVNETILTHWYLVLYLFLMSSDSEAISFAFQQAFLTIRIGFVGSTMLIPIMLTVLEKEYVLIDDNVIGFLSSAPLFNSDVIQLPQQFLDNLFARIEMSQNDYNFKPNDTINCTNLKERSIKCIFSISDHVLVLPSISTTIVDELMHEKPSKDILTKLLKVYVNLLPEKKIETLHSLMGLLPYFNLLMKNAEEPLKELIHLMANDAFEILKENEEYIFHFINTLTSIFIYSFNIIKDNEDIKRYIILLDDLAKRRNVSESFPKNLSLLAKDSLQLLTIYFGGYPFPNSPLFPSNMNPFIPIENATFYTPQDYSILKAEPDNGNCVVTTINNSGQYVWKFEPLEEIILDSTETVNGVNVEITDEPPRDDPDFQVEFQKVIDSVVDAFEAEDKAQYPLEIIDDSDIEPQLNLIQDNYQNYISPVNENTLRIRPNTKSPNSAASALVSIGKLNISRPDTIRRLRPGNNFSLHLQSISTHSHRYKTKIAVVYVGYDKEDEGQILSTTIDETSPHFREFLNGLGWPINLSKHCGYNGQLDIRNNRNGQTSVYYSDFSHEAMFHVAPLLPTDQYDSQQVFKKRHIGNDNIHIIYCDSSHSYDTSTISSPFGMIKFIIYPLPTGLFHVDVYKQEELSIDWFGPLHCSAIVSKKALPSLVRTSAIKAMVNYWNVHEKLFHPILEMSEMMENIINNFADVNENPIIPFEEAMDLK